MIDPIKNFKNPWEADGEYAQKFLNIDRILDRSDILKYPNKTSESDDSRAKGGMILFVNGLTQITGFRSDSFMPEPEEKYWFKRNKSEPKRVLDTETAKFINGEYQDSEGNTRRSYVSTAEERYWSGFEYARKNYITIVNELRNKTQTQKLYIVSHSQGGAFSEGMARFINSSSYGQYKVDIAIHLQPSSAANIPMLEDDVRLRIGFYTFEDPVANKFGQRLLYQDFEIFETKSSNELSDDFYTPFPKKFDLVNTHYIFKNSLELEKIQYSGVENQYSLLEAHWAHQHRPFAIWNTIETILNKYATK